MHTRLGIVLTAIVLATTGLAVGTGAAPAGAAGAPAISVNPSAGLEDGQTVTILGTEFLQAPLSAGWRALQCDAGILDGPIVERLIAHCDPNGPPGATATAGSFVIPFAVHRTINVGEEGRAVTCGNAPQDCALVVASGTTGGGFVGAATPISFFGDHTLTVTPSTGLSDGQTVSVTGTGFVETPVVNDWSVAMCRPEILDRAPSLETAINVCDITSEPFVFTHADANGSLSTPYAVRKTFSTTGGPVTCGQAPNDCALLVAQITTVGFVGAAAPISFGKPVPTLGDCIRTFLADHQHRPSVKLHRLLVCIFVALTHKPT